MMLIKNINFFIRLIEMAVVSHSRIFRLTCLAGAILLIVSLFLGGAKPIAVVVLWTSGQGRLLCHLRFDCGLVVAFLSTWKASVGYFDCECSRRG